MMWGYAPLTSEEIMEERQKRMLDTMREILQEGFLELGVKRYTVTEDWDEGTCRISCELSDASGEERWVVEGEGVGTIDALFGALKRRLSEQYPSLESIAFSQFSINGLIDEQHSGTNAQAEAVVGITNSEGREFVFKAQAPSISRAGIEATLRATEYFVNSEKTFVRLGEILEHYRSEGRAELVQKYTALMAEVVKNTSYSEVVEKIRSKL